MSIKFLLVCRVGGSLQRYLDEAKGRGVQIDVATTIKEFYDATVETPYSGLMIDMPTKIKDFSDDREKVDNILQLFPVIRLTFNEKTKQIKAFYSGLLNGTGSIEEFVTHKCLFFSARTLRAYRRKVINFNVILSKSKSISGGNSERTVTMNVSQGGCFIYSIDKWEINSDVWFTIKELTDQTPIHGLVLRQVDCGVLIWVFRVLDYSLKMLKIVNARTFVLNA
jgi:hypothetical protein